MIYIYIQWKHHFCSVSFSMDKIRSFYGTSPELSGGAWQMHEPGSSDYGHGLWKDPPFYSWVKPHKATISITIFNSNVKKNYCLVLWNMNCIFPKLVHNSNKYGL